MIFRFGRRNLEERAQEQTDNKIFDLLMEALKERRRALDYGVRKRTSSYQPRLY